MKSRSRISIRKLKAQMKRAKTNAHCLAKTTGYDPGMISRWLRGIHEPRDPGSVADVLALALDTLEYPCVPGDILDNRYSQGAHRLLNFELFDES